MYRESNRSVGGAKDGWTEQEFLRRTGSSTEERFAGTDWTDSPLRDDGRMPLPSLSVSRVQFKGFLSAASSACCPRPAAGCSYFSTCPHVFSVKTWAPGLTRAHPCVYETELLRTCRQLQMFGLWVTWSAKTLKPISKTRTMWTDGVTRLKRGRSFETVATVL